jgi:hypothetical protein
MMRMSIRVKRPLLSILCGSALFLVVAQKSQAQASRVHPLPVNRPRTMLILTGTLGATVSPASINFALSPAGVSVGSPPVTITTSWAGVSGALILLNVYGYFSSPTQALVNSVDSSFGIPPSSVLGLVSGANGIVPSYTAFNQITPFSGASGLNMVALGNLITIGANGSFTNGLTLEIDLTSQPTLPAGTYNGSLNIVVQAL